MVENEHAHVHLYHLFVSIFRNGAETDSWPDNV